jgi:hypothetical protein
MEAIDLESVPWNQGPAYPDDQFTVRCWECWRCTAG